MTIFAAKVQRPFMDTQKKTLMGMSLAELRQVATDLGMPAFTGGQMADWLYRRHVSASTR